MSNLKSKDNLFQVIDHAMAVKQITLPYVEVVFGAPGKMCNGAGICKILPVEQVRVHWKCPSARAWLGATPNGTVSLTFDRQALSSDIYQRYFGQQIFQVEEPYTISQGLLSMLNMHSFTVEQGDYSVEVSEYFIVVSF